MWIALLLAALAALVAPGRAEAKAHPSVVLIVIDTLRADHLSCYGYQRPTTPHIDALAARGVLFGRVVSQAPWTTPSVASIFTSKPPWQHGAIGSIDATRDHAALAESQVTLAERFRAAGYRTAAIVTNPNIMAKLGFAQGFDTFTEKILAPANQVSDWAIEQIQDDDPRPLFLYVHYMDPHSPYAPPAAFRKKFSAGARGRLPWIIRTETLHSINFRGLRIMPPELQYMVGLYDGDVAYTDEQVGRLIDALSSHGLLGGRSFLARLFGGSARGIVALTADHGEEFLDHGGVFHGFTVYRELTHVPLILAGAGIPAERVNTLVRSMDIGPTLLDFAGLRVPADVPGKTLRPVLAGDAPDRPAPTQAEMTTQFKPVKLEALETGEWKVLHDYVADRTELYHVADDPKETRDRHQSDPTMTAQLRDRLHQLRASAPTQASTVKVDADTQERLRQLGY